MRLNRFRAWFFALACVVALGACALLYRRTQAIDIHAHEDLKDLLQNMRQVDADLGKGVLASRYGLINQYDALTHSSAELEASRAELDSRLNGVVYRDARSAQAAETLDRATRTLRNDIEQFKTQNSILKNSLFYLPVAGETLAAELSGPDPEFAHQVNTLVRSTLMYNLVRTETLRQRLLTQLDELRRARVRRESVAHLAQFLRHAETVIHQEDVVDPIVARVSSNTLTLPTATLESLCDEHLEREAARANSYRVALSALVVLLVVSLLTIAQKLRRVYANLEQQVADRTRLLAEEKLALELAERVARLNEGRITAIIEGAREGIIRLGPSGEIRSLNPAAVHMLGATWLETRGRTFLELAVAPDARLAFLTWLQRVDTVDRIDDADCWHEVSLLTAAGRGFLAECSVARRDPALDEDITLFARDVSQAKRLEAELRQAQKLESVGRLASGIAHEINTPVQFVSDSCFFVRESFTAVEGLLRGYKSLFALAPTELRAELDARAHTLETDADLEYLLESTPKALDTMVDGLQRVAELVAGMRNFAHPDHKEMVLVDLNRALKSTLTIARNEYKYVADLQTDLADLPPVVCHAGEINQVILNIIVNAAHAIGDIVKGTDKKGLIRVSSRAERDCVVIAIADSGGGIPPEVQARIFDPFFTTKEVGRGTGQGLAIARSVVVDKHHGQLTFECEPGQGTTFHIRLPLEGQAGAALTAA